MADQNAVLSAVKEIHHKIGENFVPQMALTLGTGLSALLKEVDVLNEIPYGDLPGFAATTVASHAGTLVLGFLQHKPVAILAGRFHLYEGHSAVRVAFPVRVMAELGAEIFIFTNAAGGLNPSWQPGGIMLIKDHLNLTGQNPLVGPNIEQWGERFPDMSQVYDQDLRASALAQAHDLKINLYEGVYAGLMGPSMETPAETRMLRLMGADAVGMSTVLEVIAARHRGRRVLGLSAITNVNNPDDMQPAPLETVIHNAGLAGKDMTRLIAALTANL